MAIERTILIGQNAGASAAPGPAHADTVVIGANAQAYVEDGGLGVIRTVNNAVIIGANASVTGDGAIAIGQGVRADADQIVIGDVLQTNVRIGAYTLSNFVVSGGPISGTTGTFSSTISAGVLSWGSGFAYGSLSWDAGVTLIGSQSGKDLYLCTNGVSVAGAKVRIYTTGLVTPNADNTQDFGSSALNWKDGRFKGTVYAGAVYTSSQVAQSGFFMYFDGSYNARIVITHGSTGSTINATSSSGGAASDLLLASGGVVQAKFNYLGLAVTGAVTASTYLKSTAKTVAALTAAATAGAGARDTVTDSTVAYSGAAIGAAVVGGGANTVPVFCTGAAWLIG